MPGLKAAFAALVLVGSAHGTAMAEDAAASTSCDAREAVFYFSPCAKTLDAFGEAMARKFAEDAQSCPVARIEVVGHADAEGDAAVNEALSLARAEAASAALIDAGLTPADIQLDGAGARDAVSETGDIRPMARRAVVRLVLAPADADLG